MNQQNEIREYEEKISLSHLEPSLFPIFSKKNRQRWLFVYTIDKRVKSLGTIFLLILSIYYIIFDFDTQNKYTLAFIAILPSIVQLFNEIISWFEIDEPLLERDILPKRILVKKVQRKKQKAP